MKYLVTNCARRQDLSSRWFMPMVVVGRLCQHSSAFPVTRHCSPASLFCPLPRTCRLLRIIFRKRAENTSQTGALAQIDHAALCYPCQQPPPGTYHFTPLTISSSARPFFAPAGVSWNNGGGSQVGRCLSIHLTRQSSHLPLSEGFIMRRGLGRCLSKGGKDGKPS